MNTVHFKIIPLKEELVSHSGLALAGDLLASTEIAERADGLVLPTANPPKHRSKPVKSHSDCLLSMIGLLCLGKTDFADIVQFRDDPFFKKSLGLHDVPSEPTFRQRMVKFGGLPQLMLWEEAAHMVRRFAPEITACFKDWVALDVDVSPFDNSNTKKEGVSFTYKQHDGFSPIFAYLGEEGYLALEEFRAGSQHCQKGTPEFLERAIAQARLMTDSPLLVRLDSGNDAKETLEVLRKNKADFIIKRNLRQESREDWLLDAQTFGEWREPREGKTVYVGNIDRQCGERLWRVVFEVTERTCDREGQQFLFPQVEIATYWTSLRPKEATPDEVIALYKAHGTSEQFHSELKTDLDLERLPSGHFDANALILTCGMVAYNVLRLIGQISLEENKDLPDGKKMPLVKEVKRRRLRSIIQDLMYMASRMIKHARQWCLGIAERNPWYDGWKETYCHIRSAPPIPV